MVRFEPPLLPSPQAVVAHQPGDPAATGREAPTRSSRMFPAYSDDVGRAFQEPAGDIRERQGLFLKRR